MTQIMRLVRSPVAVAVISTAGWAALSTAMAIRWPSGDRASAQMG